MDAYRIINQGKNADHVTYHSADTEALARRIALDLASMKGTAYALLQGPGLRTNGIRVVATQEIAHDTLDAMSDDDVAALTQHVPFVSPA